VQLYDYQSTSMNKLEFAGCAGSAHRFHRMRSIIQPPAQQSRTNATKKPQLFHRPGRWTLYYRDKY
jgi:hypothetical protein